MTNNENSYLTISEIFSLAWQEIKERFVPFFLLAGVGIFINWLMSGLCFGFNPLTQTNAQEINPVLALLVSLISALVGMWSSAALVLYICKRTENIKEALLMGLTRIWRLLLGSVILIVGLTIAVTVLLALMIGGMALTADYTALAALIGVVFILLILAASFTAVVYCLFLPYKLILTQDPIFACFTGSFALVKGNFWRTCGYLLIISLIVFVVGTLGSVVVGILSVLFALVMPALVGVIAFLWVPLGALMALVFQVSTVALYLDRNSGGTQTTEQQDNAPSLEQGTQQ